jgi:hypothetical protein
MINYPTRHKGLLGSGDTVLRIPNLVNGWAE